MTKDFNCPKCQAWFKEKWHLNKHIAQKHPKNFSDANKEWIESMVKKGLIR
jgi:uncharacterized C2H2 Zn-finger protein